MSKQKPSPVRIAAILAILAMIAGFFALIIPDVATYGTSHLRADVKIQLNQWAGAMEQFRVTYGYYPSIDGASSDGTHRPPNILNSEKFAEMLTAHRLDGTALTSPRKRIVFYVMATSELGTDAAGKPALVDAFGNWEIAVLYDNNSDGLIKWPDDVAIIPTVSPARDPAKHLVPPGLAADLVTGIRAGVLLYSAGKGDSDDDIIYSWK